MSDKIFGKKNFNVPLNFSKLNNVPLYQISVNLENFRFWDQISPQKCEWQKFWKNIY